MRYPILFTGANKAMAVLGMTQRTAAVEVTSTEVRVQMGWAFRATIPLSHIAAVAHDSGRVSGWGVHGWRGQWLVNGSSSGVVRLDIDPPVSARAALVPVRLRVLRVSLADPSGFVGELEELIE